MPSNSKGDRCYLS